MILQFGTFQIQNAIIKKYEVSKFASKITETKKTYNLYVQKNGHEEEETFFIVASNLNGINLERAEIYKKPCKFTGKILKNTTTHKTIFLIDEAGSIELVEE